ncbi:MAG: hypothetical protein CMH22_08165 [Methylophaga sp.]|uniref:hypothetical protein n=1 Tax=Methylophaga sp. UBA678 TaxID=1946901 RepID=UPI000C61753B|nr:hypothetical protein [Methylophaga sp. UBA678]MAX51943.1 hypothetical protein [Methylophaga sp.]|tara:strand:- start:54901 stop:55983 length:1083 start_codon:yes stop_codon:yes gene_type:complete
MSASNKKWLWALIILTALAVIFVGSFWDKSWNERLEELVSSHQQFEDDDDSEEEENANQPLIVTLADETIPYAGIDTLTLHKTLLFPEFKAYAEVVDIRELIQWRARLNQLRSAVTIASVTEKADRLEWERLKKLAKGTGSVASKNVIYAETSWREAKANLDSAAFQLEDAKTELIQSWGESIANWVMDKSSKELERLINRHDTLLMVTLPIESSLPADVNVIRVSRAGDRASARKAYFVSPAYVSAKQIQGETYYFRIATGKLRLGMRLDAWIPENSDPDSGFHIPDEAIVWYSGQPWAYIQLNEASYKRIPLSEGKLVAGGIFTQSEFEEGNEVVISGAQMLLSEEFRWQIHDEDDDD